MKKIIITLFILQLFSCANRKENNKAVMEAINEEVVTEKTAIFSTEKLIAQKLTNYFELIKLKEKHPEFKDDIIIQLKSTLKDSSRLEDKIEYDSIENIREVASVAVSDSTQKIKLYYDVVLENGSYTDSINAFLESRTVIIEGNKKITKKVTFLHF